MEVAMAKQQLINRAKYKDIKRYDHNQMEQFACALYEQGIKDGAAKALEKAESSKEQMDLQILKDRLLSVKGVGAVKAEQIIQIVKEVGRYEC
jgi:NAD-dependent DNA ligase